MVYTLYNIHRRITICNVSDTVLFNLHKFYQKSPRVKWSDLFLVFFYILFSFLFLYGVLETQYHPLIIRGLTPRTSDTGVASPGLP